MQVKMKKISHQTPSSNTIPMRLVTVVEEMAHYSKLQG